MPRDWQCHAPTDLDEHNSIFDEESCDEDSDKLLVRAITPDRESEALFWRAAALGDLKTMQRLKDSNLSCCSTVGAAKAVRAAAKGGHVEVLEWLHEHGVQAELGGRWAARVAAEHGHVDAVRWLWHHGLKAQFKKGGGIVRGAAQGAQLDMLSVLRDLGIDMSKGGEWAVRLAAASGSIEVLEVVANEIGGLSVERNAGTALRGAASAGHVHVLQWVVDQTQNKRAVTANGKYLFLAAAEGGHLMVLEWLLSQGLQASIGGGAAVWCATKAGHLNAMQWLAEHGLHPRAGGTASVRAAVKGGNVNIVAWLAEQGLDTSQGGGFCGPPTCAALGHIEILQWLVSEGGVKLEQLGGAFLAGACKGGRMDVLQWLTEAGAAPKDHGPKLVVEAAAGGHIQVLAWLQKKGVRGTLGGWEAVQAAARGGHLHVLDYLSRIGLSMVKHCSACAVGASAGGHTRVLDALIDMGADITEHASECMEAAAAKGHLEVLDWLSQHDLFIVESGSAAVRRAVTGGHLAVVQWLFEHTPDHEECWISGIWAAKDAMQEDIQAWLLEVEVKYRAPGRDDTYAQLHSLHRPSARKIGVGKTVTSRLMPERTSSNLSSGSGGGNNNIAGLQWMMGNVLDEEEGIYDLVQRQAASGSVEALGWVRGILGDEWVIRTTATSGQLGILQWLVDDGLRLDAYAALAVRLAAENGHLEMLQWFYSKGLPLGETTLEAAAAAGMHVVLDVLQAFQLPLANDLRLTECLEPYLYAGKLNAMLLANCVLTPAPLAEHALNLSLRRVVRFDHQGRQINRAIMGESMYARTFDFEPSSLTLRSTIAPGERSTFDAMLQAGDNIPVEIFRVNVRGATSPHMLFALVATEREEVYDTLAAQAIIQAAWGQIRAMYWVDFVLSILQLLSTMHLTWVLKPVSEDSIDGTEYAYAVSDGLGVLPVSFWPTTVLWLKDLIFEIFQAKAFLYDYPAWRREYLVLSQLWDWVCLTIEGALVLFLILGASDDFVCPILSFMGFTRWWKVLYALRGFTYFGRRILPILGAFRDILPFTLVVFFYGGAFIHALYAISPQSLGYVTLMFFRLGVIGDLPDDISVFGTDMGGGVVGKWSGLQVLWFVMGTFLVTTALMNIFIAIMSSAFDEQVKSSHASFNRVRASICLGYDIVVGPKGACSILRVCPRRSTARTASKRLDEEVWLCCSRQGAASSIPKASSSVDGVAASAAAVQPARKSGRKTTPKLSAPKNSLLRKMTMGISPTPSAQTNQTSMSDPLMQPTQTTIALGPRPTRPEASASQLFSSAAASSAKESPVVLTLRVPDVV